MSNTIYSCEKRYEEDVKEYERQRRESEPATQLSMLDVLCPARTQQEIAAALVGKLKEQIAQQFAGKKASRQDIHAQMLPAWFGRITTAHVTQALKALESEGTIVARTGAPSNDYARFTFKAAK